MAAASNGLDDSMSPGKLPAKSPQPMCAGRPTAQVRGVLAERVVVSSLFDPLLSLKALASYSSLSVRTLRGFTELPPDRPSVPAGMLLERIRTETEVGLRP